MALFDKVGKRLEVEFCDRKLLIVTKELFLQP